MPPGDSQESLGGLFGFLRYPRLQKRKDPSVSLGRRLRGVAGSRALIRLGPRRR